MIKNPWRICAHICMMALCLILVACGDKEDKQEENADAESAKIEIRFKDEKNNEITTFNTDKSGDYARILTNPRIPEQISLIAIFPQDCEICDQTRPHIANLSARINDINAIILRHDLGHNDAQESDFLIPKNARFKELISIDNSIVFLVDSIKRNLNIEIRDYNAPLFLLTNKDGLILRSYEGPALEEILEIDINKLKKATNIALK